MRSRAEEFAPNWVRWGDAKKLTLVNPGPAVSKSVDQLVKVDHDRPLTWGLMMVADFLSGWGGAASVDLVFHVELGVGSARTELQYLVHVVPPFSQVRINDPHPVIVPAQNLNIWAELKNLANEGGTFIARLSAYAAPQFHEQWVERAEPGQLIAQVQRRGLPGAHR